MNELRRFSRRELLEVLLESREENEKLREENEELKKQLEDRRIVTQRAGSIAEAALELSKVFEAAQDAADLYVENIRAAADMKYGKNTDD